MRKIDKSNVTGLSKEKKELLKSQMGSASAEIDLNKVREWWKNELKVTSQIINRKKYAK